MLGGDEHNDIESNTGPQEIRSHGSGMTRCRR